MPDMKNLLDERRRHRSDRAFRVKKKRHETALATLVSPMRAHTRESFDALASSVGVERRDPLASLPIVRFHFATPENSRLRGNQYRLTHRTAMRGLVPNSVLDRTTKAYFTHAIRRHLPQFQTGRPNSLRDAAPDWVDPESVALYLASTEDGRNGNFPLWSIWALAGCHLVRRCNKR